MRFEFSTATQIVFGPGTLAEAGKLAKAWGRRALVVTGRNTGRAQRLLEILAAERIASTTVSIAGEPTVADVVQATEVAGRFNAEMVIAFGGGSVIDAAKAISVLLTNEVPIYEFLEVVGNGLPIELPGAPWMAIPTTAGTGAEVTRNAVLSVPERRLKVSLRSPHLLARVALVDPELTLSLPPELTASTGLDALTQLIEAYVSCRANPLVDALCAAAIPKAAQALPVAYVEGSNLEARTDLSLASLWSGLALANAGLGAVHGFASPIGGAFSTASHGAVCGALLGPVMEANLKALSSRALDNPALARYGQLARWLSDDEDASAEEGVAWVRKLVAGLKIPSLSTYGVTAEDIPDLAAKAQNASSMKANPLPLEQSELEAILREAL